MKIIRTITFFTSFIGYYMFLYYWDPRFNYYVQMNYNIRDGRRLFLLMAVVLGAPSLGLHLFALLNGNSESKPSALMNIIIKTHYGLLTVLSFSVIYVSYNQLIRDVNQITMFTWPFIAFFAGMLWLDGTVLRLYRLRQKADESARLSASYDEALSDKYKSERFRSELITNLSHDIKTPLTSIISYVNLIEQLDIDNDSLREYTAVLQKKAQRLKILLDDLMDATKAGTGNITVECEKIDLTELIGQVAGEFEEAFTANNLNWLFKRGQMPVYVKTDGRHLYRVLENIIANAVKYAMNGTRIYADIEIPSISGISDEANGTDIVFSLKNVSRDPLGITADELTERFVRGDRSRHSEGSGLGLYIAKSLTEAVGGRFVIEIIGDLFCVSVRLPKA